MHCLRRAASRFSKPIVPTVSIPAPRVRCFFTPKLASSARLPSCNTRLAALQVRFNSTSPSDATSPPPHRHNQKSDPDTENKESSARKRGDPITSKREARLRELDERDPPPPSETVYIANLFFDLSGEDLRAQMEKYGVVKSAVIIHDNRGISKGFGYVQYETVEEARNAVEQQHLQILAGRETPVMFARSQTKSPAVSASTNTLYIGNIPFEFTDRDMQELFHDIKNVIDIRVPVGRRTGMPRGFVHAEFVDSNSARQALDVLRRKAPYGRKLQVNYALSKRIGAKPKERKPKQMTNPEDEL